MPGNGADPWQFEYTFKHVYPTLAIVEDENPPAYEPVSLSLNDDDARSLPEPPTKPTDGRTQPVTSSFRAINRLLRANGGFRANFRGLACFLAQGLFSSLLMGIFTGALSSRSTPIATLLASLTLVQYSTAWVHIVVSEVSPLHFWKRLPPFKRTFEATWKPVAVYWLANEVHRWVPDLVAMAIGLKVPSVDLREGIDLDPNHGADSVSVVWKTLVILVVSIAVTVLVVLPAQVVLVRVQASLLPPDQDAIIPFDRSFEGRVEPAVVGGRGHATMADAWATFSRTAWKRLVFLQLKIFAVVVTGAIAIALLIGPQVILILQHSKVESGGDL